MTPKAPVPLPNIRALAVKVPAPVPPWLTDKSVVRPVRLVMSPLAPRTAADRLDLAAAAVEAPVPPRAIGNVPDVTAEASMAIALELAAVSLPWASTVKVATLDAEPYDPPVTAVLARSIVVVPPRATSPPPLRPVPAVTVRSLLVRDILNSSAGDSVTVSPDAVLKSRVGLDTF